MGDNDRKCFPRRSKALPVPRSTNSSEQNISVLRHWCVVFHTLQEQRQEGDEKHQEDRNNATSDPVKDGDEIVATWLSSDDVAL